MAHLNKTNIGHIATGSKQLKRNGPASVAHSPTLKLFEETSNPNINVEPMGKGFFDNSFYLSHLLMK